MNKIIQLDSIKLRPYQVDVIDAIENKGIRRAILVWPRRSGKDFVGFYIMLRAAIRKVGVYFYCLPTFRQAKLVIWDSITNDGKRFLDFIPKELIASMNSQEMKIKLINGSMIQLIGSDTYDTSLVGTNPKMIIFSEFALSDVRAYQFSRPILTANLGVALLLSTPRGKNSFYEMFEIAKNSPDWFVQKLTIDDTHHIDKEEIQKEIESGEMSYDLVQQEYYTSWDMGVEGSYYARYLDEMRLKGQIGTVPWESAFPVFTAWDLGVRDTTCIIWFQAIGQTIRVINCYEKNKEGLEHYVKVITSKPYTYAKHFAPHDIAVKEFGSGLTRIEKAKELGIRFTVAPNVSIEDGIESVRSSFNKIWIDEQNCMPLIKALENYRQEYDSKKRVYNTRPLHNWASNYSDAFRYLCLSLPKTKDSESPEALDKRYRQAMGFADKPGGFFDFNNQGF